MTRRAVHLENTRSEPGEEQIAEYDVAIPGSLHDSAVRLGAIVRITIPCRPAQATDVVTMIEGLQRTSC